MQVMLLGATGYLGGNIAEYLAAEGHTVICVVRPTSDINRLRSIRSEKIRLISTDPTQLELTFQQDSIDWVINGVCTYKPNNSLYGDMLEANVIFPLSVLNLAIKYRVKNFLTMGTSLPDDFNVYSFTKSKLSEFGKYLSEKDGINFAELKLEMFYGGLYEPDTRFLKNCVNKLEANLPIELTEGFQRRDMVHVEDVLGIISAIVQSDYVEGYRVLHVGCGEQHSIREMVSYLKMLLNSDSELLFGVVPLREGEPDTVADIAWYQDINYRLKYDFYSGLKEAYQVVEEKM